MAAIWRINGVTFASLGLSGLRRELRTLAPDVVTFAAVGAAYDSADVSGLALGDVVSITREVAAVETQWFKGVVTQIPREGAPEGEALTYEVTGPWYYLEQLVYQQRFPLNATANPTVGSPSLSRRAVSVIGQDYLGQRQTNIAELTEVLDWCIGAGAGFSRGSLPTGFTFPYTSMIAPTCAEAARACLKWMPDAASRFDYSVSTPVLSVVRRGAASAVSVDLDAPPATIADLSVTPRPDLKVDHVVIQRVSVGPNSYWIFTEDKDPVGSTGLEFGSLVIPLDSNTDVIPDGLAANWRSSLSTLQYQGRLRFVAEDCDLTARPGDVLNLTNGVTAWATMNAQINAVNEDVDAGTTEWIFGPPAHLSIQDFIAHLRGARQQVTGYNGPALVAGRRKTADGGEEEAASSYIPTSQEIAGSLTVGGILTAGGWDVGDSLTDLDAVSTDHETRIASIETTLGSLTFNAADLTGTTLASGVTASSLTSLGTLTSLGVSGLVTLSGGGTVLDVPTGHVMLQSLACNTSMVAASLQMYGSAGKTIDLTDTGLSINTGTFSASINFAALTHNMSVVEIDVCDSGTPKKMLVLGSAPY